MNTDQDTLKLLAEIRDAVRALEKRYEEYAKKFEALQLNKAKAGSWVALMWWTLAIFMGIYLAAIALKAQGVIP